MHRHTLAALLIALAFLGIADSWYLANAAITNTSLVCNIKGLEGCNVVAQSAYSHVFGIPLGIYGVIFYVIIFILGALLFILPKRIVYHLTTWFGVIGVLTSLASILIQAFLIKALCVYCLGSDVLTVLILAISLWLLMRHAPKPIIAAPGMQS